MKLYIENKWLIRFTRWLIRENLGLASYLASAHPELSGLVSPKELDQNMVLQKTTPGPFYDHLEIPVGVLQAGVTSYSCLACYVQS
jgi:hypothetical protein